MSLDLGQAVAEVVREVVREEIRSALRDARNSLTVEEPPLTYKQAAAFVQCDVSTIGGWVKNGSLPSHGRGKLKRVYRADLLKALEHSSTPKPDPTANEIAASILNHKVRRLR